MVRARLSPVAIVPSLQHKIVKREPMGGPRTSKSTMSRLVCSRISLRELTSSSLEMRAFRSPTLTLRRAGFGVRSKSELDIAALYSSTSTFSAMLRRWTTVAVVFRAVACAASRAAMRSFDMLISASKRSALSSKFLVCCCSLADTRPMTFAGIESWSSLRLATEAARATAT